MVNMISLLLHIIAYHYDVSIGCTQVDSTPLNVLARGQVDNYSLDFFPWHEMAAWLESTIWTCHNVITITDFLLSLKHNHVYPMLWASNQTTHPHQRLLCCFFPGAWLKINGRVWLHKQPPLCCSAPEIGFGKGWGRSSMLAQLVFRYESILSCWSFLLTAFVRDYCTWDSCTRVEKQVALKDSCEYFLIQRGCKLEGTTLKKEDIQIWDDSKTSLLLKVSIAGAPRANQIKAGWMTWQIQTFPIDLTRRNGSLVWLHGIR